MLTQCRRTISKREQERGETAQQPSKTADCKGMERGERGAQCPGGGGGDAHEAFTPQDDVTET